jgi:mono/diheme cytochrome c family protein
MVRLVAMGFAATGFAAVLCFSGLAQPQGAGDRGSYLMRSIAACGNCHTQNTPQGPRPGMELAGGTRFDEPFGLAYAPNITPDPETGLGKWTDEQLILAIREGKRPGGSLIGPPMPIPLYRGLADDDLKAIVAYLRAAKPVANKVAKSEYEVPLPPSYGAPVATVSAPAKHDTLAYGAYLAGPVGHCLECHSTPGNNGAPDFQNKTGGGGMSFNGPWGVSYAPNITPTNLGTWRDADIKKAITEGVRPDGVRLKPPMAYGYYKNIAPEDLDSILAYLRTLKPL